MIAAEGQAITALLQARKLKGSRSNAITGFGRWLRSDDPTDIPLLGGDRGGFSVMPNHSTGSFTVTPYPVIPTKEGSINAKVYGLLGRVIYNKQLDFSNNETVVNLDVVDGIYILKISDSEGECIGRRLR